MAEVRVLGGSIGIAASSAIVGVRIKDQVGTLKDNWLPSPGGADGDLTPTQQIAVQQAYSDAFNEGMRICAIIGALALLVSLVMLSRKWLTTTEYTDRYTKERMGEKRSARTLTAPTDGTIFSAIHQPVGK